MTTIKDIKHVYFQSKIWDGNCQLNLEVYNIVINDSEKNQCYNEGRSGNMWVIYTLKQGDFVSRFQWRVRIKGMYSSIQFV